MKNEELAAHNCAAWKFFIPHSSLNTLHYD